MATRPAPWGARSRPWTHSGSGRGLSLLPCMAALGAGGTVLVLLSLLTLGRSSPEAAASFSQLHRRKLAAAASDMDFFVKVSGTDFVVGPDCKKYFVSGWNQWEAMEAAAGALELYGAAMPPNTTGPALVRLLLDRAQGAGLNVMRTWAHPVTQQYAMSTAPGQYNEKVFRGLDYLLDEARKRGIRVLLALTDNWQPTGGADQFVAWAGSTTHEDFFTQQRPRQLYKDHVKVVLTRVNTVNGRTYKDDPTIFGWNLINEPRCYRCGEGLQDWIREMAAHVKAIDPGHLLTGMLQAGKSSMQCVVVHIVGFRQERMGLRFMLA